VSRGELRIFPAATYATLERLERAGRTETLDRLRIRAKALGYTGSSRWRLSALSAFVIEAEAGFGWGRAVFRGALPTEDPDRFYRTYIKGRSIRTYRALLERVPTATFSRVEGAIARLAEGVGKM
jgi:hypothetical protein